MKININDIRPLADELMGHCQSKLGFAEPPELFFQEDEENATETLGKTAYYSPGERKVVIYVTGRHGKDILRSIAHELVHHMQNCRGDFDDDRDAGPGYAQRDPKLRNMEAEAYLLGNMLFRDWEDGRKAKQLQEQKEKANMNIDTIKKLVKEELMKILRETKEEVQEEKVEEEKIEEEKVEEETEEIEEQSKTDRPDRVQGRDTGGRRLDEEEDEEDEALEEGEKPDFLDVDKDGDKEESMKDAAASVDEGCPDEEILDEESTELEEGEAIETPEQESTLYESRFRSRDTKLFKRLMKKWVK